MQTEATVSNGNEQVKNNNDEVKETESASVMPKEFVHLHLHTEYSILDGMAKIATVTKRAKAMGMPAIAITDHGNMYGAVNFFDACEKEKIKPIFGTEFYVCDDLTVHEKVKTEDTQGFKDRRHLILLVKNEQGYKNICLLNSIAFRDGFYYKPRIDLKTLEKHSEGLVCLSACIGGDIPQAILNHNYTKAEELVAWFKRVFGDDFYLEMQNHGMQEEDFVNKQLRIYAKKYDVKTVVTNDVHYVEKSDAIVQDVLMCVQTSVTIDEPKRMRMPCDEFYLKSYEEMCELFPEDIDAVDRTVEIAEKCNFHFVYGHYMFPHYLPSTGQTPIEYIRSLIDEGIRIKYGEETTEIRERIESELQVIEKQGFVEYFLIVWDYINAARSMGISVGPGRGSGAGSIVAYLINITDIDPLKYNLYFERFLNSERVSAPDFDVDFEDSRRQEVIEYVRGKYGYDTVAKIVTFGTMAAKNAIKDVGRVLRVPYSDLDKVTKAIPGKIIKNGETLEIKRPNILQKVFGFPRSDGKDKDVDYSVPELVELYNSNSEIKRVADIAMKLEDSPRQSSTHACGVIIGADILDRHMPLSRNGDDITTQYTGVELEHLGFLKMDFLGLRNLSDIKMCIQYVKENYGVDVVFDRNGYDDQKVFELISSGNTAAIFQIESSGFQSFLSKLKPNCIEDIVAAVSLYRPGPMDSIPKFIANKHNSANIQYAHPLLKPILEQTYGCIVYQEQVMKIVQNLAGYTLGQADMVRRMMGKKKVAEMEKEEQTFVHGKPESVDNHGKVNTAIDGCLKRGVPEDVAKSIWNEMKDFAKYAFNKSHAAAYSLVTYQTAYLKCYYEPEFLTAVLNNRITNISEINNYVSYAKDEKIDVLQPDINQSKTLFSVKDGKIRFGLAAIKGVGLTVIDDIIAEREKDGEFTSFENFAQRCAKYVNKRLIENLIYAGAFDCFSHPRSQLIAIYEDLFDRASTMQKEKESSQLSLFSLFDEPETLTVSYPELSEYDEKTKLAFEKEVVGVYVSGHPLKNYADKFRSLGFSTELLLSVEKDEDGNVTFDEKIKDGASISMGGIVSSLKKINTKSGQTMLAITLEDMYGTIEAILFPKVFDRYKDKIEKDAIIIVNGRLQVREDRVSISVDKVELFNEKPQQEAVSAKPAEVKKKQLICVKLNDETKQFKDELIDTLCGYPGDIDVYFKIDGKNYKMTEKCRICKGLLTELTAFVDEEDIIIAQ